MWPSALDRGLPPRINVRDHLLRIWDTDALLDFHRLSCPYLSGLSGIDGFFKEYALRVVPTITSIAFITSPYLKIKSGMSGFTDGLVPSDPSFSILLNFGP